MQKILPRWRSILLKAKNVHPFFFALKHGPASGVTAIDRISVMFVPILAALFLTEQFTLKSGIGMGLIAIGAILVVLKQL